MEDYKPNSYKAREREEKKKELPEKRRTEKVISGQVKIKKKSGLEKFSSLFIPDDVDDAKTYIIQDVVVPAVKDIIMDTISAFLGINNRYRSNKRPPGAKVNYTNYYTGRERDRRDRERSRQSYDYENIVLESRSDAEDVLDNLYGMLDEYGSVSVNDLYDAVGCTSRNFTDARYGWTDLRAASVVRDREGYRIKLPKPMPLD